MAIENGKIICSCCGKSKKHDDFYASQSYINKHTGKLSICKECVWDYAVTEDGGYDFNKAIDILKMLDKPYIQSLMDSSIDEGNKANKNHFKIYMKNLGLRQNRDLRWENSDFEDYKQIKEIKSDSTELEEIDYEIDDETYRYWGRGYEDWEYSFLNDERYKLMSSFECPDYGMEMIMKDICFLNLDIEKIRQEKIPNSQKAITTIIETRSKLMNSANMNPIQSTGAEANDQITFGTLIKKWENERPVPKPLDDEMKEYIDTFMVGHLAKMEGLNNEMTEKYDKALSKYTINFSDINKSEEEFDD